MTKRVCEKRRGRRRGYLCIPIVVLLLLLALPGSCRGRRVTPPRPPTPAPLPVPSPTPAYVPTAVITNNTATTATRSPSSPASSTTKNYWLQPQHDAQRTNQAAEGVSGPRECFFGWMTNHHDDYRFGPIQSPATIASGLVYVTAGRYYHYLTNPNQYGAPASVLAYNLTTGTLVWFASDVSSNWLNTPIVVTDDSGEAAVVVVSGVDGWARGYDALDGSAMWTNETYSYSYSAPVVTHAGVLCQDGPGYCLDGVSGAILWEYSSLGGIELASPLVLSVDEETLFALGGVKHGVVYGTTVEIGIYAIAVADGSVLWNTTLVTVGGTQNTANSLDEGPVLSPDGTQLFVSLVAGGTLTHFGVDTLDADMVVAVSTSDGSVQWRTFPRAGSVGSTTYPLGLVGSLATSRNGLLYTSAGDALRMSDGTVVVEHAFASTTSISAGAPLMNAYGVSRPLVDGPGELLYTLSADGLTCRNASDLSLLWHFNPAVFSTTQFQHSSSSPVLGPNGELVFSMSLPPNIGALFMVHGGGAAAVAPTCADLASYTAASQTTNRTLGTPGSPVLPPQPSPTTTGSDSNSSGIPPEPSNPSAAERLVVRRLILVGSGGVALAFVCLIVGVVVAVARTSRRPVAAAKGAVATHDYSQGQPPSHHPHPHHDAATYHHQSPYQQQQQHPQP